MGASVRLARHDDVAAIAPWTRDTFEWGDYVAERLPAWIDDPALHVMVCEDDDGAPLAVARAQMLSPTEAWLDAARVHPDHRREGLGKMLNRAGVDWSKSHGAQVVRLAVERDNPAALSQVDSLGYTETARWAYGHAGDFPDDRLPELSRLQPAARADLDPAWMFWANSDLALTGRELLPVGWLWRRMTRSDLEDAARARTLWQGPAGWLIGETTEHGLLVPFVAVSRPDAPDMVRALIDLANGAKEDSIEIKVPAASWLVEALQRSGFETKEMSILSKGV